MQDKIKLEATPNVPLLHVKMPYALFTRSLIQEWIEIIVFFSIWASFSGDLPNCVTLWWRGTQSKLHHKTQTCRPNKPLVLEPVKDQSNTSNSETCSLRITGSLVAALERVKRKNAGRYVDIQVESHKYPGKKRTNQSLRYIWPSAFSARYVFPVY